MTTETKDGWTWWASSDGELYQIGPCASRAEAIAEAVSDEVGYLDDGAFRIEVCEARIDPMRLADFIGADGLLERADEEAWDSDRVCSEFDDGPIFDVTPDQEKDLIERIKRACDEWQEAHGLTFKVSTFSAMRNGEVVTLTPDEATAIYEGRAV